MHGVVLQYSYRDHITYVEVYIYRGNISLELFYSFIHMPYKLMHISHDIVKFFGQSTVMLS